MGMTLREHAKSHFFRVCNEIREVVRNHMQTDEGKKAFIILSVRLHAAKGGVPKYLWPWANKAAKGKDRWEK